MWPFKMANRACCKETLLPRSISNVLLWLRSCSSWPTYSWHQNANSKQGVYFWNSASSPRPFSVEGGACGVRAGRAEDSSRPLQRRPCLSSRNRRSREGGEGRMEGVREEYRPRSWYFIIMMKRRFRALLKLFSSSSSGNCRLLQ